MSIGNEVIIGPYKVTLENIDNSVSGQQTWTYKVSINTTPGTGQEISHWNLELCANHTVLSVSKNGVVVPAANAGDLNIVIENPRQNNDPNENKANYCYDPPVPPLNIKWNTNLAEVYDPNNPNTPPGTFDFTLQGQYGSRDVQLNLKGGVNLPCTTDTILGPTCEQTRGYDFSKLLDIDFAEE